MSSQKGSRIQTLLWKFYDVCVNCHWVHKRFGSRCSSFVQSDCVPNTIAALLIQLENISGNL